MLTTVWGPWRNTAQQSRASLLAKTHPVAVWPAYTSPDELGSVIMSETEWVKAVLEFAGTALGVLLGLLGNSYVGWRQGKQAYRLMLTAINSEAANNGTILRESFCRYYRVGLVFRGFSVNTVSRYLSDREFIKYAHPSQIALLGRYLRAINLANAYRKKHEYLYLSTAPRPKELIENLIDSWGKNLADCERSIGDVLIATRAANI